MLIPDNVWLAVKPVVMRAGTDTLTQYVQNELNAAWHDGAAFVFTN
ncbi:IS66 family insertion sequence element accessory protein TnpB, partial [Escherichia coli]|nr:IS66 family insertion sequence element accessory protein TnpB [Escherichia coli]